MMASMIHILITTLYSYLNKAVHENLMMQNMAVEVREKSFALHCL